LHNGSIPRGSILDDLGKSNDNEECSPDERLDVRHFAYPFGDRKSWQRKHMAMAEEAGFVSAVSTIPGVIEPAGHTPLLALPRISWDGRRRSMRAMRVILSGSEFL